MADAKHVAQVLEAQLYVASAGLGLICGDDEIAPYDLTVSGSHVGLKRLLHKYEATPEHWWSLLCGGRGLAHLLAQHPRALLHAALPATYVEMVARDLHRSPPGDLQRLRLFTSVAGAGDLPAKLACTVMPYDERLESVPSYAGTRADFPQRAMRHFVVELNAAGLGQNEGRAAVHQALSLYHPRISVERQRADDNAIKSLIQRQWQATGGRGSLLLRYLRDDARIACEQSRFARLWREVRAQKQQSHVGRVA